MRRVVSAVAVAVGAAAATAAAFAAPAPAASASGWRWPVRGEVVEPFDLPAADPYARGRHRGVDLAAPRGTQVRAACPGRVRFAGRAGDFGRAVSQVCGGYVVTYGHLASVAVEAGELRHAGDRLGAVGTTGRSDTPGPHLHLGVRRAGDPHGYVDPLALLPAQRPAPIPPTPLAPRRPTPLRPTPFRPTPLPSAAPRPHPAPSPTAVPPAPPRPTPVPAPTATPSAPTLPATVWLGLALLAAAVPGLALFRAGSAGRRARTVGRRRQRRAARA